MSQSSTMSSADILTLQDAFPGFDYFISHCQPNGCLKGHSLHNYIFVKHILSPPFTCCYVQDSGEGNYSQSAYILLLHNTSQNSLVQYFCLLFQRYLDWIHILGSEKTIITTTLLGCLYKQTSEHLRLNRYNRLLNTYIYIQPMCCY